MSQGGSNFSNLLSCNECATSFPKNYQLEQHAAKNKHKAYLCSCSKTFTKLSALRRHIDESTLALGHQCPLCDNNFKRPGHVEQHLRLVHKKPNDVIKDLLSAQKSQPPQEPRQASTASSAVPTTGSMDAQADYPIANPGGPWTGPINPSAPAPTDYPGSRPVDFSALSDFSALGPGHMTEAPAFAPQSFMTQTSRPHPYSAYPTGAGAAQTGFPANPAPDFVGYPAAHSDGNLDLSNVDLGSLFLNLDDGLEMPALGNDFTWEPFGSYFNTFDF
ncbi:hypothetical protein SLS63_009098 [Diaporthe eres]|uniref:C2H2-type domain-containing protein n=1 Tax=Diaporthe eres TaxID=83184 RepID=A0ABR1P0R0_DIAER